MQHFIIARIDECSGSGTHHFPLIGCFSESKDIIFQRHTFAVDKLHPYRQRLTSCIHIHKPESVDLGQSGRNTPLDAVLLSFSKEDAHLYAMLPLRKSTYYRSCLSLIRHTGTSIFIFRKQFLGSLHQKLFICRLPTPVWSHPVPVHR